MAAIVHVVEMDDEELYVPDDVLDDVLCVEKDFFITEWGFQMKQKMLFL
jgi:hypothetical protein